MSLFSISSELSDGFRNYFSSSKSPPSICLIFISKLDVTKAQRVLRVTFLGTMRLFENSHFPSEFKFFQYLSNTVFHYNLNF